MGDDKVSDVRPFGKLTISLEFGQAKFKVVQAVDSETYHRIHDSMFPIWRTLLST